MGAIIPIIKCKRRIIVIVLVCLVLTRRHKYMFENIYDFFLFFSSSSSSHMDCIRAIHASSNGFVYILCCRYTREDFNFNVTKQ